LKEKNKIVLLFLFENKKYFVNFKILILENKKVVNERRMREEGWQ